MKRLIPFLLVAALWSADSGAQSETDEEAILETFESWNRGWTEADADLAVQDYAEDTDWTNAFGDRFETSTGEVMPDRHINHLRVFQKRDGRWLIVSHLISQAKQKR